MEDEELNNYALLNLHKEIYGNKDYNVPENSDLPPHEDFEGLKDVENLIDALEKSVKNGYNAIRIYEYLSEEYEEHYGLFEYLAVMEHGRYESPNKEKELYEKGSTMEKQSVESDTLWKHLGLEGI